jgi:hypothetical protein
MPYMLSIRDFALRSTAGLSVEFVANTPVYVPDALVPEAMEKGCIPTEAPAAKPADVKPKA